MNAPDFWDNQEEANKLMKELKFLKGCTEPFKDGLQKLAELNELIELSEGEAEFLEQIEAELKTLHTETDRLELQAILSGEFDRCNAIFSINAGAGGTESCDWASMLLRMYTRWVELKEFTCEVIDTLYGEEAGIKSAPSDFFPR